MEQYNNTGVTAPSKALQKLDPAIDILRKNLPVISEKVQRAKVVSSAIKTIANDEDDKYAEQFLVKARTTMTQIKEMRLEGTRKIDEVTAACMLPEKELQAEMDRVKMLRDAHATEKERLAKEEQKRIDRDKNIKLEEIRVKNAMKEAVEIGIAKKLSDLETAISKMFFDTPMEKISELDKTISSVKPSLKQDYYLSLFDIKYDKSLLCEEAFKDLQKRAQDYFWDEKQCGETYIQSALEILTNWKGKIPSRKKELEKIAAGDESAKNRAEVNKTLEEQRVKKATDEKIEAIVKTSIDTQQEEALSVEFVAQVESQQIEELSGVRRTTSYRLNPDVEKDMVKLAGVISKIIINVMTEPGFTGIFQRDRNKFVKNDAKTGMPLYADGVSFWLDALSCLSYAPRIEGLIETQDISTVAKAK
jgi:hypothetical protein